MASCNPVFFEIGKSVDEVDENIFPEFVRQFGYGSATGIGMEEAEGTVPDPKWKQDVIGDAWYRGDAVNMGIGQGYVTATPMQIANVYSALPSAGCSAAAADHARRHSWAGHVQGVHGREIRPLPVAQTTSEAIRYGLYLVTQSAWHVLPGLGRSSVDAVSKSGWPKTCSRARTTSSSSPTPSAPTPRSSPWPPWRPASPAPAKWPRC
jgi:hypothetical protein